MACIEVNTTRGENNGRFVSVVAVAIHSQCMFVAEQLVVHAIGRKNKRDSRFKSDSY